MKEITRFYDNIWNNFNKDIITKAQKDLVIRWKRNKVSLNIIKNKLVLDAGCGSGKYSIALKMFGARTVIGLDKGEGKKLKYSGVEYIKGDVLKLQFKDNTFDFVFCTGVLHHTKDTYKGLEELYRVLKPNGYCYIYLYGKSDIWDMVDTIRKKHTFKDGIIFKRVLDLYQLSVTQQSFLTDIFFVKYKSYLKKSVLEKWLKQIGFNEWRYLPRGTDSDFCEREYRKEKGYEVFKNADLKYLIRK